MTLNDILINEMNFEIGNGKTYVVQDQMASHKVHDKVGDKDEVQKNVLRDANELSRPTKLMVRKILDYIKAHNLVGEVSHLNLNSSDIVMKADGGATINFDNGRKSINISARDLRNFNY